MMDIVGFDPEPGTDPSEGYGVFTYADGTKRRGLHPQMAGMIIKAKGIPGQNSDARPLQVGSVPTGQAQPVASLGQGGITTDTVGDSGDAPPQPAMAQPPRRIGGLVQAGMSFAGAPRSGKQMQDELESIDRQAETQQAALAGAAVGMLAARSKLENELNSQAEARTSNAEEALRREQELAAEADRRVSAALAEDIGRIDPKRKIKSMSTGQTVMGGLGVFLARLGNPDGQNSAISIINKAIDDDIRSQQDELDAKRANRDNRVRYWTDKLGNAERGVAAAKVEALEAARLRLEALKVGAGSAEHKAEFDRASAQLGAAQMAEKQKIVSSELDKLRVTYAPPQAPAQVSAKPAPAQPLPLAAAGANSPIRQPGEAQDAYVQRFRAMSPNDQERMLGNVSADMSHVNELERAVNELEQLYSAGNGFGAVGMYRPDWSLTADDRRARQLWSIIETQTRAGWKSEPNGQAVQERLSQIGIPTRDADVIPTLARHKAAVAETRRLIESGHIPEAMAAYWAQNPQVKAKPITGKVQR